MQPTNFSGAIQRRDMRVEPKHAPGPAPAGKARHEERGDRSDPLSGDEAFAAMQSTAATDQPTEQAFVDQSDRDSIAKQRAGRALALASDAVVLTIAAPFFAVWFVVRAAKRLIRGN